MLIAAETANRTVIGRHNRDSSRLKLSKPHFTGINLIIFSVNTKYSHKHNDLSFRESLMRIFRNGQKVKMLSANCNYCPRRAFCVIPLSGREIKVKIIRLQFHSGHDSRKLIRDGWTMVV